MSSYCPFSRLEVFTARNSSKDCEGLCSISGSPYSHAHSNSARAGHFCSPYCLADK